MEKSRYEMKSVCFYLLNVWLRQFFKISKQNLGS